MPCPSAATKAFRPPHEGSSRPPRRDNRRPGPPAYCGGESGAHVDRRTHRGVEPTRRRVLSVFTPRSSRAGPRRSPSTWPSRSTAAGSSRRSAPSRRPSSRHAKTRSAPKGIPLRTSTSRRLAPPRGFASLVAPAPAGAHRHHPFPPMGREPLDGARGRLLARTPVVVAHEHNWSFEGKPLRVATDRYLISRLSSMIVCVSRGEPAQDDRGREDPAPAALRVLPNGIPPLAKLPGPTCGPRPGSRPTRASSGSSPCARDEKRLDVLVDAIGGSRPRLPNVHVAIAGFGNTERDRYSRLRLSRWASGIASISSGSVVTFRTSSQRSTSPASARTGRASPCPSSSTWPPASRSCCPNVGGIPDMIRDGVEGLLVPRRDPDALAAALKRLLLDRTAAEAMGKAAQERQRRELLPGRGRRARRGAVRRALGAVRPPPPPGHRVVAFARR